mgnify:CR=1 FL=1
MGLREVLRMLWFASFINYWYNLKAYKSEFVSLAARCVISIVVYYFWGYSIVYQKGIQSYGTESPLGFILSGILLAEFMGFRWAFSLHMQTFYHVFSRPVSPHLQVFREWFVFNTTHIIPFRIIPCALLIIATQRLNIRLEALLVFLALSTLLCFGQHFMELGATFVFKKERPVLFAFEVLEEFSGRAFPITILPETAQQILSFYPPTWAYLVWRKVLFAGMPVTDPEFLVFSAASLVMFLSGLAVFRVGVNKIYREGLVL